MAAAYGFEVAFVTYKWPSWLRQQTSKQRIIWGCKILFLDVLFPLNVNKVIYVDSDQVCLGRQFPFAPVVRRRGGGKWALPSIVCGRATDGARRPGRAVEDGPQGPTLRLHSLLLEPQGDPGVPVLAPGLLEGAPWSLMPAKCCCRLLTLSLHILALPHRITCAASPTTSRRSMSWTCTASAAWPSATNCAPCTSSPK